MIINTAERFLVLIQHPERSRFLLPGHVRSAGLVGSVLLDLSNEKNIGIEQGRLILINADTEISAAHKQVLSRIRESEKSRKIRTWVRKLSRKSKTYQNEVLLELQNKEIVEIVNRRFLIFPYHRTRLINKDFREHLIGEIRKIIFHDAPVTNENSLILGLVDACSMYRIICRDRRERKLCKAKIKDLIRSDSISRGVDEVIRATQAAVIAAVVASSAAASAGSK